MAFELRLLVMWNNLIECLHLMHVTDLHAAILVTHVLRVYRGRRTEGKITRWSCV